MGSIYELICWTTGLRYIGSTKRKLKERLWEHNKKRKDCSSYYVTEHNNFEIYLLEYVQDINKLKERECYYITHSDCVNVLKLTFDKKVWLREHRMKLYYEKKIVQ